MVISNFCILRVPFYVDFCQKNRYLLTKNDFLPVHRVSSTNLGRHFDGFFSFQCLTVFLYLNWIIQRLKHQNWWLKWWQFLKIRGPGSKQSMLTWSKSPNRQIHVSRTWEFRHELGPPASNRSKPIIIADYRQADTTIRTLRPKTFIKPIFSLGFGRVWFLFHF